MAKVTNVKLRLDDTGVPFVTWVWSKNAKVTKEFLVSWRYQFRDTKENTVWSAQNYHTVDKGVRYDSFSLPSNAIAVKVSIKPHPVKSSYFTGEWCTAKTINIEKTGVPETPSAPTVTIDGAKVTVSVTNVDARADKIHFQVARDDSELVIEDTEVKVVYQSASYTWTAKAGYKYRAKCRAKNGSTYSAWSSWSDNYNTRPVTPTGISELRATSISSVYLAWESTLGAETYDIQYTTDKTKFEENSDELQTITGIDKTNYEKTGLESGYEYFFRVRSVNAGEESPWSPVKSIVLGKKPAAPTTWSSTTTVISGEDLILYWVHNTQDGSSQIKAEIELTIDGVKTVITKQNSTAEDEKDKTSFYDGIDTSTYTEGSTIKWRVRTCGITNEYGDWSVLRTVNVYAKPSLEMTVTKPDGSNVDILDSFPFVISASAGPETQEPITYHLSVLSNKFYNTIDQIGNEKTVNMGEAVYSKFFDISTDLTVEISPSNLDLENNIDYTIECVVTMNSGLTAEAKRTFTVAWSEETHQPDAQVVIDEESYTAIIRPFCAIFPLIYYKVDKVRRLYIKSEEIIDAIEGELVENASTTTDEPVYSYVDEFGSTAYFTMIESEEGTPIPDLTLSVYRREYDGKFVKIGNDIDSVVGGWVSDPHPALDFARYRIVATSNNTGAVSYYDIPGEPVHGIAAIIQWNEEWSDFKISEAGELEEPPSYSGSILQLPYNIDVSDSNSIDVALVEYIGREHPVSYYGTQLGTKSTWNMDVPKSDKETLYALRKLSIWTGDVYVREPSGSGYLANISVSFSQKHKDVVIPVTLSITRVEDKDEVKVEGGI